MRSKVEIESLADDFSCWQRFGHDIETKSSPAEEPEAKSVGWGGTVDPSGMVSSHGNMCGWQWNKDPRLECLGLRGVFASDTTRKSFIRLPLCSINLFLYIPLVLLESVMLLSL